MAEQRTDPHDSKVHTVPLPAGDGSADGEQVIAQENQSAEVAMGGGGWPSPETPATGPSPGDGDEGESAPRAQEVETGAGTFEPIRDALEADPVAGGSGAVPDGHGDGDGDDRPKRASLL